MTGKPANITSRSIPQKSQLHTDCIKQWMIIMYVCSSLFKISDFYPLISANYWCVFHYFSCVLPVWRLPGNMFCPSTITFHPRRPAWSVGMKLLAVIMELSLVEAAKSSLKELLKVKGLAHPFLFFFLLYLLDRGTNFPGPSILIISGTRSLAGPSQSFSEPKEASFVISLPGFNSVGSTGNVGNEGGPSWYLELGGS